MRALSVVALGVCSAFLAGTGVCTAQEHIRASLNDVDAKASSGVRPIRASLEGTPGGSGQQTYAVGNNILEIGLGSHGKYHYADEGEDTARYPKAAAFGLNFIHKFGPHFGMGFGYERVTTRTVQETSDLSNYPSYYYGDKYVDDETIDIYKLMFRFIPAPYGRFTPEVTLGIGGFAAHFDETDDYWNVNSYGMFSGSDNYSDKAHGKTASAGLGGRYYLKKWWSIGVNWQVEYIKASTSGSEWVHFYQYGVFTGLGF